MASLVESVGRREESSREREKTRDGQTSEIIVIPVLSSRKEKSVEL